MAATPKRLIPGSILTTSWDTYYTAPAGTTGLIKELAVCNLDSVARAFSLAVVPSGVALSNTHVVYYMISVSSHETKTYLLNSVIPTGSTVQVLVDSGTANVVSISASGVEFT